MKQEFKGFLKIFSFTFRQHVKTRNYMISGILIGLICLLLPVGIMGFMGWSDASSESTPETEISGGKNPGSDASDVENSGDCEAIRKIYVVDADWDALKDPDLYSCLNQADPARFTDVVYEAVSDVETAAKQAKGSKDTLLLVTEEGQTGRVLNVLLPEDTKLTEDEAGLYRDFLYQSYPLVQMKKADVDVQAASALRVPVETQTILGNQAAVGDDMAGEEPTQENQMEMVKKVLSMVLPYLTIMLLYFMILFYGQGVATSVLMEKNSKLMDMFLVTVKPGAMILGKVLAIAASGLVQLFAWIACLAVSFMSGIALVKAIDPGTDMLLIQVVESFGQLTSGMFSITGIVFALLIMIGGFLLYCALAAIGGAMASKPEDLSTTNILFTLILIASFFCALYSGVMDGGGMESLGFQVYIPFTAIMVAPGMALLGEMSIIQCMISLGLILASALIVIWIAGKIYKLLIFHKGDPLSIQKVFKLLLGK
ncbi:MAG: ABC transporter permease [Lachnospiraceae bacterium]|nr:ABC transporter permease [Lachnospiraceae bacterium]